MACIHPNSSVLKNFIMKNMPNCSSKFVSDLLGVLISCGIKIIATDFDLTMITKHSGGHIDAQEDERGILTSLSGDFDFFASAATKRNLRLVCVTFSDPKTIEGDSRRIAGESLVKKVLEKSRANFQIEKVYAFWPENWAMSRDYKMLNLTCPMPHDKSYHLQKVCEDYRVTLNEILLIDDDISNCRSAARAGALVLHVTGKKGFNFNSISTSVY